MFKLVSLASISVFLNCLLAFELRDEFETNSFLTEPSFNYFDSNQRITLTGETASSHNGSEYLIKKPKLRIKTDTYSSYLKDSLVENDVRTITEGRSEILPDSKLFIEESNYGRTLLFNSDGSLRWTHVNRAQNGKVYRLGWSRILHTPEDIQIVKKVLSSKETCNE